MGDIVEGSIKELKHKIKEIIQNEVQSEGNRTYVRRKYQKDPLSLSLSGFLSLFHTFSAWRSCNAIS